MNKVLVTGDLHGSVDIRKLTSNRFPEGKGLTKQDYVIILGDFGLVWYYLTHKFYKETKYWLNWLRSRPWTTLFIDGNHENFDLLNQLPVTDMLGGKVHVVNDSVFHLMRGEVYTIGNKTFLAFGGAESTDKEQRVEGISWWRSEIPNYAECENAMVNIERHQYTVDYVLSHAMPHQVATKFGSIAEYRINDPVGFMLEELSKSLTFKHWFFGHMHVDVRIDDKYTACYNDIHRLV